MTNKMVFPIIRDFIILLCVGALTLACQLDFGVGDKLHNRGWFRGDQSISLPMKADTVAPGPAAVFAFGCPLIVMIILWFACDRIWSNSFHGNDIENTDQNEFLSSVPLIQREQLASSNDKVQAQSEPGQRKVFHWGQHVSSDSSPRSRKLRFALYQFFVLCLGMCFVITVTTAIKLMVGRLRPDWISRCMPDYSNPDLKIDPESNWIAPEYAFICTNPHKDELIEGRKSFPSAHSSTAVFGGTVSALLLWKRCWNRGQRAVGFVVIPFAMMAVFTAGVIIAVSRNWDNRHFATDIIAGSVIGIAFAFSTLLFNAFTPSWETDSTLTKSKNSLQSTVIEV